MSSANVVDWEQCKENARPLKSGYKITTLESLLNSPDATQRDDLEEQRQAHEATVAANGGNDPLAAWKT
jgi:hypothetical protein